MSSLPVSSIHSRYAARALPSESASNGRKIAWTLAEAYAPRVRVNAILPGPFLTDVTKAWPADSLDGSFVPLGRLGRPEELAPLAVHLASAASSYTTGAIVRVDGGITRKV